MTAEDVSPEVELREKLGMIGGLIAAGRAHSRKAHYSRCPECRSWTLTGYDAAYCAEFVRVDPTPLSAAQRAACGLAGRRLYTLREVGGRAELDYLDEWANPADEHPLGRPIVPEHICRGRFT